MPGGVAVLLVVWVALPSKVRALYRDMSWKGEGSHTVLQCTHTHMHVCTRAHTHTHAIGARPS